ncbi:hypothetical protein LCGC14_3017530 [marine sediment metagenome]|uniref:Uncharacterized protein n=1 Tax=marine sediment metagenome TaxID=412755 RepID=A0A0F8WWR9_9ZZZZ
MLSCRRLPMLSKLLIFLLLAGAAHAQTDFRCAVSPEGYWRALVGKGAARHVRVWTCVVNNRSPEPLVVSEGALLGGMMDAGINAQAGELVRVIAGERQRLGLRKTIGRALMQVARIGALFVGAGVVELGDAARRGIVFGNEAIPGVASAISNRAPSLEKFEQLFEAGPFGVDRYSNITVFMFSGPWDGPLVVKGVLDAGSPATAPNPAAFPAPVPTRLRFELWSESSGGGTRSAWVSGGTWSRPRRLGRINWPSPDHMIRYGGL